MKHNIRLFLLVTFTFVLVFGNISPGLADDEPPPDIRADTPTIVRVNDLAPGVPSSNPTDMVVYGGNLYFSANANNGLGTEMWVLGNPNCIDVNVGTGSSTPQYLTSYNGAIYFAADGGDGAGKELWKYDSTNGPQIVLDIYTGSTSSSLLFLTVYQNALYFGAKGTDGAGVELWKYEPVNGAQRVADIYSGSASSSPMHMEVYDGALYFGANGNDGAGVELWKYDPANGAQRVADIYSGVNGSTPRFMSVYNGVLYFNANGNDGAGTELWSYDPVNGVQRAADIATGAPGSDPIFMAVYNGALYFSPNGNDLAGYELWKYDPVNGADRVADIQPGTGSADPQSLTVFNGALYFSANGNDGYGRELWKYDNVAAATFRPAKAYDGWVLESGENTSVGGTLNSNAGTFLLGDNAQNKQYRSLLSFNTSALPDNAVIVSATLRIRQQGLTGQNPFATHSNILVDVIKGAFSGNNALQITDFQAAPGKAGVGVIKNLPDVNNWFTAALTKLAYPHINKVGVTQFRLRFTKDDNNDNGADTLRFFSADSPIFSDYPLLEVKYYVP